MIKWKERLGRWLLLAIKLIGIFFYDFLFPMIWLLMQHLFKWTWRIVRKKTVAIALLVALIGGIVFRLAFPSIDLIPNLNTFGKIGGEAQRKTVQKLLQGSWEEQQQAVRESLAGVSITVASDNADVKPGTLFVLPPELILLTADANRKPSGGHLTLDRLADLFRQAGFPFAEGQDPALLMQSALRKWVLAAQEKPKQEGSYAPLFLQAMAQQQIPSVDLTAQDWDPADYRMTHLELQIFLGAIIQALPTEVKTASLLDRFFGETAYAAEEETNVCSRVKTWLGDWGTKKGGDADAVKFDVEVIGILFAELVGKGVEAVSELVASVILPVISMALKLMKLVLLYWSVDVTVEPDKKELHKPASNEAALEIAYLAKVGVNEEKYKEYLNGWNKTPLAKKVKDCLSTFGFPVPTDTAEIAADVDKWSVEWSLVQSGGHATIGQSKNKFELPGQLQMKVNRTSDIAGEAKLIADVTKEQVKDHDGEEKTAWVVSRAQVETSSPPAIGTFLSGYKVGEGAAKSGILDLLSLTDTLLDILAGWYQEMVTPEAYGYTQVAYHQPKSNYEYTGWITMASERVEKRDYPGGSDKSTITAHARAEAEMVPRANSDLFDTRGFGKAKLSAQFRLFTQVTGECADGTITNSHSAFGSGRHNTEFTMNVQMTRTGSDQRGYTFTFRPIFQLKTSGNYDVRHVYFTQLNGCKSGQGPSNASRQREELTTHSFNPLLTPLELTVNADRPFPKTLSGGKTTTNDKGETIMWTFKFDRRETEDQASTSEGKP